MTVLLGTIINAVWPYLLAAGAFFAWKFNHDRKILAESRQKDQLRQQAAIANALAIEQPSSSELRNSLQRGEF